MPKSEKLPNYLPKILQGIAENAHKAPEGVGHILVKHVSCCWIYKGKNCNCNPDVSFYPSSEWPPLPTTTPITL